MGKLKEIEVMLAKPCTGEVLRAAVKKAVQEVGGHVEEKIHQYYAPAGSSHVQPSRVTLSGSLGTFFLYEFVTETLELKKDDYDRLRMYCETRFPKGNLDKFASALNRHIK